jgi:hypothetical protein
VLTNPSSRRLAQKYEECVASFIDLPYCEIGKNWGLNLVQSDWQAVEARPKARRVL